MPTNFYMFFVAALIPMIIGAIYYHPKVLGSMWMRVNGFTMESLQGGNMAITFGLAYLFSLMLAIFIPQLVLHQGHVYSLLMPEVMESGSDIQNEFVGLMENYGERFRSFGHGALHATGAAILFALPILGTIALFERRGWKYIAIHFGYWLITLVLMGGLLCGTLEYSMPA